MGCQGGGKVLIKGMLSGRVAKGGGKNFDKRNVVLELESLEAWVAKGGGMLSGRVAKHGLPRGGGGNLIKGMLSGRVAQHGLPRGGRNFDKRNAVLELESLEAWVAKGGKNLIKGMLSGRVAKHGLPRGMKKFDKRNVVLELESLKAWVAKGGENLIKKDCCQVGSQSMGCQGGVGKF